MSASSLPSPDCMGRDCCPGGVCPLCHERVDDDGACGHCYNCGERLCVHAEAPDPEKADCVYRAPLPGEAMLELEAALAQRGTDDYEGPDRILAKAIRLLAVLRFHDTPEPLATCACGQGVYVTLHRDGKPGSECGGYGGEGVCCRFGAKPGPCETCGDHEITADEIEQAQAAHEKAFDAYERRRKAHGSTKRGNFREDWTR